MDLYDSNILIFFSILAKKTTSTVQWKDFVIPTTTSESQVTHCVGKLPLLHTTV